MGTIWYIDVSGTFALIATSSHGNDVNLLWVNRF